MPPKNRIFSALFETKSVNSPNGILAAFASCLTSFKPSPNCAPTFESDLKLSTFSSIKPASEPSTPPKIGTCTAKSDNWSDPDVRAPANPDNDDPIVPTKLEAIPKMPLPKRLNIFVDLSTSLVCFLVDSVFFPMILEDSSIT